MNKGTITQFGRHKDKEKDPFLCIEDKLKPLLVSMTILGIYFDPTQAKNKVEPSETSATEANTPGWWRSINRLYCYTVLLLLWFNFGRCAVGVFPLDEGLPLRIIVTTWVLLCAVNATIILAACQKLTHFRSFYKHWNSVFRCTFTANMGCGSRFPAQYLKLGTATGWFLGTFNVAALCIIMFCDLSISPAYTKAFARPFPESQWVIIFNIIMQVFQTGVWIFPIIYISIIARVIRAQFLQLGKVLSNHIQEADGHFPDQLPELRFHYMQLCQAVDIVNRSFKWLLGSRFILDIFLACFVSYQIINGQQDIFVIAVNVFWLGGSVVFTLVSAMCSSGVHEAMFLVRFVAGPIIKDLFVRNYFVIPFDTFWIGSSVMCILEFAISSSLYRTMYFQAHSLLDDIFSIGTKDVTLEQLGQLNLFLTKMTGTSIGFTAIDFFVITKEFILTLSGLFMTYFFLLLQFKIA